MSTYYVPGLGRAHRLEWRQRQAGGTSSARGESGRAGAGEHREGSLEWEGPQREAAEETGVWGSELDFQVLFRG